MGLKKGMLLNEQYQKLKETALSAERFLWSDGEVYAGPVAPVGIYLWMSSYHHLLKFWFVLAERVPPEHLNGAWDEESPLGYITLDLDNNLEFVDWDSSSKTFTQIYGACNADGTVWSDCVAYANNPKGHISMAFLFFENQGNGYTCRLMQKN